MQALILAGGFGSRLMPVINDRPKVMAPVNGKPFLEILISYLKKQDVTDIVLALGYLSGHIRNYFGTGKSLGVSISYSTENMPLGTGGAIKNASPYLKKTFIVQNGDTFIPMDYKKLTEFHTELQSDITIGITKSSHIAERGLVKVNGKNKIISFSEVTDKSKDKDSYTNMGIYIMNKNILSLIPSDEKVSLEKETFPAALKAHKALYGFIHPSDYTDIGTPENYRKAQTSLL